MTHREQRDLPQKASQVRMLTPDEGTPGPGILQGYFAVWDGHSRDLGGFVEAIDPRAFDETLRTADLVSMHSHQITQLLGRTSAGNLTTWTDNVGAGYRVVLRDNATAREVADFVRAGFLLGSSFQFQVVGGEGQDGTTWGLTERGYPLRTLKQVRLFEVGPTGLPAYESTEQVGQVALRSLAEVRDLKFDEVADAARRGHLADIIGGAGASDDGTTVGPPGSSRTETYRRRLQLAEASLTGDVDN